MECLSITSSNFEKLLAQLSEEGPAYIPHLPRRGVTQARRYQRLTQGAAIALPGLLLDQSLKEFLFPPREPLAEPPSGTEEASLVTQKFLVCGAKACDLAALRILDAALGGDDADPFYASRRKAMTVISGDCPSPDIFCHCTLFGGRPWPTGSFDVNLSPVEYGYIVEFGSEKGKFIAERHRALFTAASEHLLAQRDAARDRALKQLQSQNERFGLSRQRHEVVRGNKASPLWREHVATCVECGACIYACPTSYESVVYERPAAEPQAVARDGEEEDSAGPERVRAWDSCFNPAFSAGGKAGPGRTLLERFTERFVGKFDVFHERHGMEACTGCGRCTRGCLGRIDIREVTKALDV